MLKYMLYVWTEEQFRKFKSADTCMPRYDTQLDNPASFEMYDVSQDAIKEQVADHFGCEPSDVVLCQPTFGGECEKAFGMTFWDVAYPEGIGSYLVVLNTLGDD